LTTQVANAGAKAAVETDDTKPAAAPDKPAAKSADGAKPRSRESSKAHDS
jgi:hypothetical protein